MLLAFHAPPQNETGAVFQKSCKNLDEPVLPPALRVAETARAQARFGVPVLKCEAPHEYLARTVSVGTSRQ